MKRTFGRLVLAVAIAAAPAAAFTLHVEGNLLKDGSGRTVRLTGVNWFGMETSNLCPHGLWARDWKGMLMQVRDMGFNCIRLPWCNAMLRSGATASSINYYGADPYRKNAVTDMNKELNGKSPLEILDIILGGCSELGIAVILDCHSREPDGYMNEKVWYTTQTSEAQWISDWVFLATRYRSNGAVVGCDLDNEPHGAPGSGGSQWGGDAAYDWKSAAQRCGNAILAANPDLLIVVEGVEQYGGVTYWWGGNLRGARSDPCTLTDPQKLVYSPHEYGPEVFQQPWFNDPSFPANMAAIWDTNFAYIRRESRGHFLIGEFGIRDSSSYSGKEKTWLTTLLSTFGSVVSWTFWCLNPNSGDTGGLLDNDWVTPVQWKLNLLKPYMANMLGAATAAKKPYVSSRDYHGGLTVSGNRIVFNGTTGAAHDLSIFSSNGTTVAHVRNFGTGIFISCLHVAPGVYTAVLTSGHTVRAARTFAIMR